MKKDYSEYFKGPSLKDARKRFKEDVHHLDNAFEIPPDMVGIGKGKTYYIKTYGCQANERDSETLAGILEMMGYQPSDDIKDADVVLLNTCAVRENAEEKVFGRIGYLKNVKRQKPDLIFGVCGCMAQEEVVVNRIRQKMPQVDLIFGTHNIHRLPQLLKAAMLEKETVTEVWSKEGDVIENLPSHRAKDKKAWVNIMYGCNKFCTYCIVPYTRGKERSRLMEDVLAEVNDLKDHGYLEVNLLGQNVNSYGKDLDLGYDFATLLAEVAKTGIPRIRFMTSHPWDFSEEMLKVIAQYDNIMPYIHLPAQSGSSEVLKLMGRQYTRESYLALFDKIKEIIPNVAVTTDIIVGFPNETNEQFEETLSLFDHCQYDLAYTFVYSPRAGTPAAKMEDNIPMKEKEERLQRLNEKVNYYAHKANEKYLGTIQKVLVDGPSRKNPDTLAGYTETNKVVNFKGNPDHIGQIVNVKINEIRTWSLDGEEVDE
ncbi:tRNA (N6-isopentenyl adenosine(37)-C2)-methylthiotransferase MiaB [Intestinibaculum porci]|uniref:tRNA (N6-isopentenyl adenosine(37)-C2)-methylthiotransferase MiaB n=1 Tax=Intestinibaculum porci TaxID=2487118 RepID=UPI0024090365|nr:tRNA (N6-isopentenyl adenosine(37)-C2)-methylthiotransferase MiaB [Intestinibaculum porci]MDD6350320.1 tRNA (N6-isopentenyl adenosine(37)-C2)-methylthiotransferase MiaB [Intestinibaculum porci]